ncbi:hypothetical protein D3C78_10960 [compost metagenome]
MRQIDQTLLLQVQQATRCSHQNVDTLADAVHLRLHANAAKDDGGGDVQVLRVEADVFFNLRSQLTGRCEDQCANAACRCGGAALRQTMQHRQRERCGLAGAGLCAGKQVVACEHQGNSLCLNRGRGFVALLQHRFHDGGCQVQFFKCHCCRYAHPGAGYQPVGATCAGCQASRRQMRFTRFGSRNRSGWRVFVPS